MSRLANKSKKKYVVADFVCPLQKQIKIFKPDFIIWMDTIKKGRYENMNKMFRKPKNYDLRFKRKISSNLAKVRKEILKKNFK